MSAAPSNAEAWGLPRVLDFFSSHRNTSEEVYASERFFVFDRLREGMSVLDVGCARGGFASVLKEHLSVFSYTGVDINVDMIELARREHPDRDFHHVPEGDLATLGAAKFDLVLVLGILHLHEEWRRTLRAAWERSSDALILDLRETDGPTIEDKAQSWLAMDFNGGGVSHNRVRLPYNIINAGEAIRAVRELCPGAAAIHRYGYDHLVSPEAECPLDRVMMTTWRIEREQD